MESHAFWSHVCCCLSVWATIESTPWCIRKSGLLRDNTHQSIIKQTGFLQTFPSFRIFPNLFPAILVLGFNFPGFIWLRRMPWMPSSTRPRAILGPMPGSFIKPCQVPKATKVDRWFLILWIYTYRMIYMDIYMAFNYSTIWHGNFMGFNQQTCWLGIGWDWFLDAVFIPAANFSLIHLIPDKLNGNSRILKWRYCTI